MVAAVAKVAASELGVSIARVGALEEVEPFLLWRDAEALAAWGARIPEPGIANGPSSLG